MKINNILILECDNSNLAYNFQFKFLKRNFERKNKNVVSCEIDYRVNQISSLTEFLELYPDLKDFSLNTFQIIVFSIAGEDKILISKGLVDDLTEAINLGNNTSKVVCISQSKLSKKDTITQQEVFQGKMIDHTKFPIDANQLSELFP